MQGLKFIGQVLFHWVLIAPFKSAFNKASAVNEAFFAVFKFTYWALVALIFFICVVGNNYFHLTGDYAWEGQGPYRVVKEGPLGYVSEPSRDFEWLRNGYICRQTVTVLPNQIRTDCFASDGFHRTVFRGKEGWEYKCCIDAQPDVFTPIRRFFVNSPILSGLIIPVGYLGAALSLLISVLAALLLKIVFSVAFGTTLSFVTSLGRGVRNLALAVQIPKLTPHSLTSVPESPILLTQLSDIHQTCDGKEPIEIATGNVLWPQEKDRPSDEYIMNRLSLLLAHVSRLDPAAVALTGDLTDTCKDGEWDNFFTALKRGIPDCRSEILLLPGNHDMTFKLPDSPDLTLSNLSTRRNNVLRKISTFTKTKNDAFPKYLEVEIDHPFAQKIYILSINSNEYPSHHSISGALGQIGGQQLNEIQKKLEQVVGPVIVLLHHHVGVLGRNISDFKELAMFALDTKHLISILRSYARKGKKNRVLILHGHKHTEIRGSDKENLIHVFGAPSSTLGAEGKQGLGMVDGVARICTVQLSADGQWHVETIPLEDSA